MENKSILNEEELEELIEMNDKNKKKMRKMKKQNYVIDSDDEIFKEMDFLKGFESLNKLEELYESVPKAFLLSQKEKITKVNPKFGEVWSVDLSFSVGCEINKSRPCIIFSKKQGNYVTILPITSNENKIDSHATIDEDFFVDIQKETTGIVKCEAIRSVSVARLGERFGRVSNKGMKKIVKALLNQLNLYYLLKINKDDFKDEDIQDFNHFEYADDFNK